MFSIADKRVTRALTFVLPALFLAGCFGKGEGPTPIAGTPAPPPPDIPPGFCDPINFEDLCGPFVFTEFEGGPVTIIDNPDVNELNPTDKVARMQKFAAESGLTFGGSTLALPSGMDFSNGEAFKMLVWSSREVPVLFKFEGLNQEREVDHSGSGMWEELCFDFTGTTAGPAATGITFIFDVTVLGDAANDPDNWTFFFDEITQHETCGDGGGGPGGGPATAAPTPTVDAANVISLFSDAYTDVTVDTWRTDWSSATLTDITIDGNATKQYTDLDFVGIETVANQVDAATMTHLHVDLWTDNADLVRIKLVDFGPDGAFDGGDDTEGELVVFDQTVAPPVGAQGEWVSLDIPLADFQAAGLTNVNNIAQYIFSAAPAGAVTLYVDNVYFTNAPGGGGGTTPSEAAPAPTQDAANVISLFSGAYTDVTVDTWRTDWSSATLTDTDVAGDAVKLYTDLDFVGVETVANQIDASGMTHFSVDVWTPDATTFRIKLVDFGPDGAFGGGDDTEHEVVFDDTTTPALAQGQWVSLDIPLTDFVNLANVNNIAQLIFSALPAGTATVYVDNVYFYNDNAGSGGAPVVAAPTPIQDPANVVSLFSDTYTDVTVDTWRTDWSSATLTDVTIDGQAVKQYTDLDFVGIETVTNQVDASGMTHFHVDIWTPNATQVRIKLVDFGADGAFGGGDDTEGEVSFDDTTTPALAQGEWISLDIPLTDFENVGLVNRNNIAQLIFSANPPGSTTLFVTNVYFYNDAGAPSAPAAAAPAPTQDAANVISLFSDAYTDVPVDTWRTDWSAATLTDTDVAGDAVKLYTDLDFVGVETVASQIDASGMTHFSVDIWTPDATTVRVKLVDFGPDGVFGGGDDTEHEVVFDAASTPALAQGDWVSLDIPLADFVNLANRSNIAQLIFSALPAGSATLYVDNVYFYSDAAPATAPTTSAPTPTQDAANVISLYSDAYTDLATIWPTSWSDPNNTTSDVTIDGGLVKEHLAINFVGVEFQVDATSMTHVHFDVWTPDATSLLFRLVDFGGDGFGGANADTSADVILDAASTPALVQGSWVSVDIPLQTFLDAGLGSVADLNQIVIDPTADGSTVYIDNVYFYVDTPATAPTTSAPTPTQDAANVISLYSDAYTDLATTWPTVWSDPNNTTSDVTIDGGLVKEHLAINFVGVEFQTDASSMTHVHFDVWTPDATSLLFRLVDFGGDGFGGANADTSADVILDAASTPALAQGSWVSVDIPLQTFLDNGLASVADLNQIVLDPPDGTTVYIDNVYFYNDTGGGTGGTFVNGDFETGDFTGWTLTQIPDTRGSIALDSSGLGGRAGTVARLIAAGDATGTNDVLISQVALAAGTIAAGDTIDVSFDLYGSLTGAGGVVFVEVIFLNGAGVDEGGRDFVGPAAPYTPTTTWTTYSGSVTAGTAVDGSQWDVSGGVTLQLKAACGAIADGCGVDAAFDNVTFTINGP